VSVLTALAVCLFPCIAEAKAILGIDLGSLYMKVALVQRGAPLEIVTNLHSKRKTEHLILFDSGSRFYGADASSLLARKPLKTPSTMSVMLGKEQDHPTVKVLKERHYPLTPWYNATRRGLSLKVDDSEYTPEELVAMVLQHAKEITATYGNLLLPTIKDVVLTIPSFATQHERRALLDAAKLADLNVLSLIDETTAAALHYGMDKMEDPPKILVFYNLGASALQVSVVRYFSYPRKEGKFGKEKTVGALEVLGKAWDSTLGGNALDHLIVEYLASEFDALYKGTKQIRENARSMTKLRLQANKIKHVLSANTEIPIYMDSLFDDTSLNTHMTRAKLEDLAHELMERSVKPIEQALKVANVTLDQVDEIELIGGGMRVPKIQQEIQEYLGEKVNMGMHLNSDESMALGAAFYGANISTAFKVRHVGLDDVNPFAIDISLNDLEPNKWKEAWSKSAQMFKSFGKLGVKKTIAFTHDRDVHCAIDYEENDILPEGTATSIEQYNIKGIEEFAKEMDEKGLGKPKVSLQFELSQSGITQLIKAEAAVEETVIVEEEEEVDDDEEEEETADEKAEETDEAKEEEKSGDEKKEEKSAEADGDDAEKSESKDATNDTKSETPKKKKKKTIMVQKEQKKVHKKTLDVEAFHVGNVRPYTPELMEESKAKLAELERKDRERVMLEESRNRVESFIYLIKNKLVDDEEAIGKVTTEEQRAELSKLASDAEEWMYDEGYNADLATMEDKYAELSTPANKVFFRVSESTARPEAIKALQTKMTKVEDLMKKWETTMPQVTEEERAEVLAKVEDVRKWISEKEEAQEKASPSEDPVFTSEEVPAQSKPIETLVARLNRKPKPKPEKKNETKPEGNETEAEAEESETATEGESAEKTEDEPKTEQDSSSEEEKGEADDEL